MLQNLIETIESSIEKAFHCRRGRAARQEMLRQREIQVADSQGLAIQLSEWAAEGDRRLFFILPRSTGNSDARRCQFGCRNTHLQHSYGWLVRTYQRSRTRTVPATPNLAEMIGTMLAERMWFRAKNLMRLRKV